MLALLVVAAVAPAAAACGDDPDTSIVRGSGELRQQEFDLRDFDSVQVSSTFDVEIRAAARFSVIVEADDNVFDVLEIRVDGRVLILRTDEGTSLRNATLRGVVTLPELRVLSVSGASKVVAQGFDGRIDRRLEVSGASAVQARMAGADLRAVVSGASDLFMTGAAADVVLRASGASGIAAQELRAETGEVSASGASRVIANIRREIRAITASGASNVTFLGDPRVREIDSSGASTVTHQ